VLVLVCEVRDIKDAMRIRRAATLQILNPHQCSLSCIGAPLLFFPESERTGPPDGGRPHSNVPGACEAVGGGEMTTVASEAAIGLPLSGEIGSHRTVGRNSSRSAALRGGWEGGTHVYPWGTVERCLQRGGRKARARPRAISLREKG
jgi:hypothetical protein